MKNRAWIVTLVIAVLAALSPAPRADAEPLTIMAIVGVAGSVHPIAASLAEVAVTLASGVVALLLLLPNRNGLIARSRSMLLLPLYACFVWATLHS